jgi:threonine/homoserine/homoserine lactone efflux protein
MLWAEGASFGVRRTMPHVVGTALGVGAIALLVAVAAGAVTDAIPGFATAMKVAGSAYLLYLAWLITRPGALERTDVARPLGLFPAIGFQALNPKVWIFALAAVTTFRSPELPAAIGEGLVLVTMMVIVVPTALVWAGAGDALARSVTTPRARRRVSLGLAGLLVATIVLVWV